MNQTFVLIKPDAIERQLTNDVLLMIEEKGFTVSKITIVRATENIITEHYKDVIEELGPDFRKTVVNSLAGEILFLVVLSSKHKDPIPILRKLAGATNPPDADPDTIRGKFGIDDYVTSDSEGRMVNNLIHVPDSNESLHREYKLWTGGELGWDTK